MNRFMISMKGFIFLPALLAFASGCVERAENHLPDQVIELDMGTEPGGDMDGEVALGEGEGAGTMEGTWLLVHENSSCILKQEQVSIADYLVDITEDGNTLKERRRICNLELSPVLGLAVTIPAATYESVEFIDRDRGFVTSLNEGGGYTSSTEVALWGLELEDPFEETLPRDVDDARVVDADGDGNPGVTFIVGDNTCERWAIQRQLIHYQGLFTTPNRIDGASITMTETIALDGSAAICRSAPPILANDRLNNFIMVRVDGKGGAFDADADGDGEVSCQEILGLSVGLNPGREPDNQNCR